MSCTGNFSKWIPQIVQLNNHCLSSFQMEDHFAVRLRGLPFDVTENQVIEFLSGCKIKNDSNSIRFLVGPDSRPLGEAFVVLENQEDLANALKHHRESLGHRYVEVMPISKVQMENELSRQPGEVSDCTCSCMRCTCSCRSRADCGRYTCTDSLITSA